MSIKTVKPPPKNVESLKQQSCQVSCHLENSSRLCDLCGRKNTYFWPSWFRSILGDNKNEFCHFLYAKSLSQMHSLFIRRPTGGKRWRAFEERFGLRSKRFRLVSEQRKTEGKDFRFWPREKWNESHFWRRLWLSFLNLCSQTARKRLRDQNEPNLEALSK